MNRTKTVYPLDSDFEHTGNDTVFIYVCVLVSVTAELSCGQDLEELLLDASLDTSRDAP